MNKNGRKNLENDIASLGGHVYSKKNKLAGLCGPYPFTFYYLPYARPTLAHLLVQLAGLPIWLPSLFASALFLGAQVIVSNEKNLISETSL